MCRPGTAVVVSPLIALMDDQVAALRQVGVAAGALHSDLDPAEARSVTRDLIEQQLDLLYVSPERLLGNGTLDRLSRLQLALFAIDEAHCVSQWGHEFRPEYRELACLPDHFPGVPRIALTATADPRTRPTSCARCAMDDAAVFRRQLPSAEPASRRRAEGRRDRATAGVPGPPSGRVRHRLLRLARQDRAHRGEAGGEGHSRPSPSTPASIRPHKRASLTRFRSGEPLVVVATIAFGMGIDRPDVRFVVHLDMPDSPEAWYQQIGRAGRDGDPAETLLLYRRPGHRPGAPLAGAVGRARGAEAGDAHQARRDRRADRDGDLPHRAPCSPASARTCPALRPLRQLRRAAEHASTPRWRRRRCSRRSIAPTRSSARSTSSPCCAARRPTRCCAIGHDRLPTFGCRRRPRSAVTGAA